MKKQGFREGVRLSKRRSEKQSLLYPVSTTLGHLFIPERDPVWVSLILGAITLIALVVRVLMLDKPVQYDEAFTFVQYASRSFRYILTNYGTPNNHILHTLLVGITYRLFGGQAWIMRLPAFAAGVLMIPAAYITARRFFLVHQALAASALIAMTAGFINFSVNARGYTMLILFALLLANFAAILVEKQTKSALLAYGITGALGFYTIPIFLYPMAGISLWVAITYLVDKDPWQGRLRRLGIFLGVCALSCSLTLLLYSPVIIFGTGLDSIIRNEVVGSLSWSDFVQNLSTRLASTWRSWIKDLPPFMQNLLLGGFFLSLLFYRKASRQKLPLQVFLILAVAILLLLQRVAPLARVWLYLEVFYLMFSAAGFIWFVAALVDKVFAGRLAEEILSVAVLLALIGGFINVWQETRNEEVIKNRDLQAEAYVAMYLTERLTPEDTIVAVTPVDITSAYYLNLNGIPYERFYKSGHPVQIQNAVVILERNSNYNTPESVLDFYGLTDGLDLEEAELAYEYGRVQAYSVPARSIP